MPPNKMTREKFQVSRDCRALYITVVTKDNGAPRTGAKVGVEGEFRSAFTLGTESVAVILEQARYTP